MEVRSIPCFPLFRFWVAEGGGKNDLFETLSFFRLHPFSVNFSFDTFLSFFKTKQGVRFFKREKNQNNISPVGVDMKDRGRK